MAYPVRAAAPRRPVYRRSASVAVAVAFALGACSNAPHDAPTPTAPVVDEQDCAPLLSATSTAPVTVAAVVDRTQDALGTGLVPADGSVVDGASLKGERAAVIATDGTTGPRVEATFPLGDPSAGEQRAARGAEMARGCIELVGRRALPQSEGTDWIAALNLASRVTAPGGTVLLQTTGVSTAGNAALTDLPAGSVGSVDPLAAADAVPQSALTDGSGRTVRISGVGWTAQGLGEAQIVWLQRYVLRVCERTGADCVLDEEVPSPDGAPVSDLDDGELVWAAPERYELADGGARTVVPAELIFASDSAEPSAQGAQQLEELAHDLAGSERIEVVGHSDGNCPADQPSYCADLSARRASNSLEQLLAAWSGERPQATARGVGDSEPVVPERTADGQLDQAAMAMNRRVEIFSWGPR